MRVWAIFKKEMRLYFTTPTAWFVITLFLAVAGLFFFSIFDFFSKASMQAAMNPQFARDLNVTDSVMRPIFSNLSVILLFFVPMVTMRLFAEERRSGTLELLLTFPVRDGAVLAGKFLAALALYAALVLPTLVYPAMVARFAALEWGVVLTGYTGLFLLGAAFMAVGLFASSLTQNQMIAGGTTFALLLLLWIIGWNADSVGPPWGSVLSHLSIIEHNESFARGIFDTKDIVYYLDVTAVALFLTLLSLAVRRRKG